MLRPLQVCNSAVNAPDVPQRYHCSPPWNPVLQFVPKHTITGRVTHEGDHHILFSMYKVGGGHMQMQFFIDEWMYFSSPLSSRNLTLWVKDSKQTGDALAETLRPLLDESESCFT